MYKIVERNIGRAGNRKQMAEKQAVWNCKYGEGNWLTGYEVNGQFKTREAVIEEIYDQSYFVFLDEHPEVVELLKNASGVYNPHALLSNSVDIQAATVERYMEARNLSFAGEGRLPIGSYQPKYKKEPLLKRAQEELGLEVRDGKIIYPKIAYTLNPFSIPCLVKPEMSIEDYWQSDIKCLAVISNFTTQAGNVFELAEPGSVLCITTNGVLTKEKKAVMGKGIAKVARDSFEGIDVKLASCLQRFGNRCFKLGDFSYKGKPLTIVSFPTKYNWQDDSDLDLIQKSASEIHAMANKFGWTKIYLPFPGGGAGNLSWSEVSPRLSVLDERFTVVSFKQQDFE